jgi:NAD(P)H-dependent flavin oxidoreductase YrpB (nitropropane dioxygenase family)
MEAPIYIKGKGNISPQQTWGESPLLETPVLANGNRLACVEPRHFLGVLQHQTGNTDAGVLASGQVAGILDDLPSCAELIDSIVSDAVKHLQAAAAFVE